MTIYYTHVWHYCGRTFVLVDGVLLELEYATETRQNEESNQQEYTD